MKTSPTRGELWARAAEREERAFVELRDRLTPRLRQVARRIVNDPRMARQILDDVFTRLRHELRALRQAHRSPEVWLALETRARAVDWVRSRNGLPGGARARLDSLPGDYSWLPTIEAAAAVDDRRPLLRKVLGQLPSSQARLLELAVRQGLSEPEIAEKLGQPEGKIRSELRAGFRFLRHRLQAVVGAWTAGI